jgi:superfamily II DNA or RNA helicase
MCLLEKSGFLIVGLRLKIMAFPLFIDDITAEEKQKIYDETLIRPTLQGSGEAVSAAGAPAFSFFKFSAEKKQVSLPFQYARAFLGAESVPGEDVKWKALSPSLVSSVIFRGEEQSKIVKEALAQLKEHHTTSIVVPPGFGKTIIGVHLASILKLKTAYIYPSNISSLSQQWITTHEKVFMGGVIKPSSILLPPIPSKAAQFPWDDTASLFDFILTPDSRVVSIPEAISKQIGTLVLDESHLLCTRNRVAPLLHFTPKYIIVLTATPERNDECHSMLELLVGKHRVYKKPNSEFIVCKKTVDVFIPEKKITYAGRQDVLNYSAFCADLAQSVEFNQAIVDTVVAALVQDRKIIILSKLVSHVEDLKKMLAARGVACETIHGNQKTHKDTKVLIGTTKKIATGYDVATATSDFGGVAADTLILTHGVKNWQTFEQSKGRIMRSGAKNTPLIFWMCTKNNILNRHLSGLKKYIIDTGGKVQKN